MIKRSCASIAVVVALWVPSDAQAKGSIANEVKDRSCLQSKVRVRKGKKFKDIKRNGVSKCYDATNGKMRVHVTFKKGKRHGPYKEWNRDGTLSYEVGYKNDQWHGTQNRYREGMLYRSVQYKDGKRHGAEKQFCARSKQLRQLRTYNNDVLDGVFRTYSCKEGKPSALRHYQAGRMHGVVKRYHRDGRVHRVDHYVKGQHHGISQTFSTEGKLTKERCWQHGRVVPGLAACKK